MNKDIILQNQIIQNLKDELVLKCNVVAGPRCFIRKDITQAGQTLFAQIQNAPAESWTLQIQLVNLIVLVVNCLTNEVEKK